MQRKVRDISSHGGILFETEGSIRQLSSNRERGYYSGKLLSLSSPRGQEESRCFRLLTTRKNCSLIVANQFINNMAGDLSPIEHDLNMTWHSLRIMRAFPSSGFLSTSDIYSNLQNCLEGHFPRVIHASSKITLRMINNVDFEKGMVLNQNPHTAQRRWTMGLIGKHTSGVGTYLTLE